MDSLEEEKLKREIEDQNETIQDLFNENGEIIKEKEAAIKFSNKMNIELSNLRELFIPNHWRSSASKERTALSYPKSPPSRTTWK